MAWHVVRVVVVGSLDGLVYGVDRCSGEVLWSFDSGGPLVSSSTPAVLPALDGSLYSVDQTGRLEVDLGQSMPRHPECLHVKHSPTSSYRLRYVFVGTLPVYQMPTQRLPFHVPDIVQASPFFGARGVEFHASKATARWGVDAVTGRVVVAFHSVYNPLEVGPHLPRRRV